MVADFQGSQTGLLRIAERKDHRVHFGVLPPIITGIGIVPAFRSGNFALQLLP